MPSLSIVIPIYNEEDNVEPLVEAILAASVGFPNVWECIFVDDGSRDRSFEKLTTAVARDARFKAIRFARNFGQTAAIAAGIRAAKNDVVVLMDGDLQNDPQDIPQLLAKIDEGYDVVSGWRKNRRDTYVSRILPSLLANALISRVTGVRLHDYGCTLKAYRRSAIEPLRLYGEMHRFIPAYAAWYGARITEIVVRHHPRKHGRSKYGIQRTFKVLLDLWTVKFLNAYLAKPMHFFGGIGGFAFLAAILSGSLALYLRFSIGLHLIQTPLPLLTALLVIVGIQFILMGLVAEMLTRIYFETQSKEPYIVRETVGFSEFSESFERPRG